MKNRRLSDVFWSPAFFFGVTLALCLSIRMRLANLPLERDEGEYACAAQILLRGGTPFLDVYNMKFPGVYYVYALFFGLFGQTVLVVRFALICANLLSTFWMVKMGRLLKDQHMGWLAGGFYLMLSLGRNGQGMIANAEHFVVAFALGGTYFLLKAFQNDRSALKSLLISGVFFSTGVLMKQHGAFYILFAYLFMLIALLQQKQFTRLLPSFFVFSAGVLIPLAVLCLYLLYRGAFSNFIFYTIDYARAYAGARHFYPYILEIIDLHFLMEDNIIVWGLGIIGFFALIVLPTPTQTRLFFTLLFLCSLTATVPGYYFRPHYYQLFLPSVALCAAWFTDFISEKMQLGTSGIGGGKTLKIRPTIFLAAILTFAVSDYTLIFSGEKQVMDHAYGGEIFAETRQVGEWLRKNTRPDDKIGMFGGEPEIFFYARRRPASGYMYHYLLMEWQPYAEMMTRNFIGETEKNRPEIFIESDIYKEGNNPVTYQMVQSWLSVFKQNYRLIGVVYDETHRSDRVQWLDENPALDRADHIKLYIYRKKPPSL